MVDVGPYATGFNPYDTGYAMNFGPNDQYYQGRNPLYDDVGWFGKKLFKRVGKIAKGVGKGIGKIVPAALPIVQQAMKLTGPIGMVASGAAGALAAVAKGSSLENIAWAAAQGAAPAGIDRAIMAAKALRNGEPVLKVAINQARNSFVPNSVGQRAFDIGIAAAKGGSKGVLASARNQLRSATEKAAFDAAIGTVAKGAKDLPAVNKLTRSPRLNPAQAARAPLSFHKPTTNLALSAFRRNPGLLRMRNDDIARKLNLPMRRILEARGIVETRGVLDTGVVDSTLHAYKVKAGDTGSGLAKKFTGDLNRWREIVAVNHAKQGNYTQSKDMKVVQKTTTINKKKVPVTLIEPFYPGLMINLPGDWNVPGSTATPSGGSGPVVYPTPSPPALPSPVPGVPDPSSIPGVPQQPPVATTPSPVPGVPMPPGLPPMPSGIPVGLPPVSTTPAPSPVPGVPSAPTPFPIPSAVPGVPEAVPGQEKKKDGAGPLLILGAAAAYMFL